MGSIFCPHCHGGLRTDLEVAGSTVKCGLCHKVFIVSDDDSADTNDISLPVLLAILIGGHFVGLLLLAFIIGLTPSCVILFIAICTEVVVWQRKLIESWLQHIWKSVTAEKVIEQGQRQVANDANFSPEGNPKAASALPPPPTPPPIPPRATKPVASNISTSSNLIPCPDCGKMVSKRTNQCPSCGCPEPAIIDEGIIVLADEEPDAIVWGTSDTPSYKAEHTDTRFDPRCPSCGFSYGWDGYKCSHCGNVGGKSLEPRGASANYNNNNIGVIWSWCWKLFIAFVLFRVFVPGCQNHSNDYMNDPSSRSIRAYIESNDFVEQKLKSPSTAIFPSYQSSFVTDLGGGRYQVAAYVDAQNGFGATLRTNYICTMSVSGDTWTLEDIYLE